MNLILVRHGETDWNLQERMQGRTDTPLNQRGMAQAELAAERLAAEDPIEVIYTSPLVRALVTAAIIGKKFNLDPIADTRLTERGVGQLEGLTLPEIGKTFPEVYKAWREDKERVILPGAEDQVEFQRRVLSFLEMVGDRHAGQRVAVVTHGGTLSMFFATVLGLDIHKRFPFRFDNTSISKVDFSRPRPRVYLLNDTCHLLRMAPTEELVTAPPALAAEPSGD